VPCHSGEGCAGRKQDPPVVVLRQHRGSRAARGETHRCRIAPLQFSSRGVFFHLVRPAGGQPQGASQRDRGGSPKFKQLTNNNGSRTGVGGGPGANCSNLNQNGTAKLRAVQSTIARYGGGHRPSSNLRGGGGLSRIKTGPYKSLDFTSGEETSQRGETGEGKGDDVCMTTPSGNGKVDCAPLSNKVKDSRKLI